MTATDFASEVNAFGVFFDKQKKYGMNVSWQSSCRTFNLDVGQTKQVGIVSLQKWRLNFGTEVVRQQTICNLFRMHDVYAF